MHAQQEPALSDGEVDKLRDSADEPIRRVQVFSSFLDQRTHQIDRLATGKRKPGREEDLHEQMEQFTSIANDLEDNLEEYGKRHDDVRPALPKLLAALDRWSTALKELAEDAAYSVSRKLALETVGDLRETATKMVEEQKAWFLAHPPAKQEPQREGAHFPPAGALR